MHEIDSAWNQVDFQGNKEITKNKFYRYLSDAKLLLNADYSKTEEMIRQLMYCWGSVPEKPDPRSADATGTQANKARKRDYKHSLDDLESISKLLFEQMFEKVIMHAAARNAIQLMTMYARTPDFVKHYSNDEMAATFQVLLYQREFLYQTFNTQFNYQVLSGNLKKHLYRKRTKEQLKNPYVVEGILDPNVLRLENKEKLQCTIQDAINKMSEYACSDRMINLGMIKTEIDFKIKELALKKKAEQQDQRR